VVVVGDYLLLDTHRTGTINGRETQGLENQ
jgi:hypothetical protein